MEMNPVEFMQPGNSERMDRLQDQLDKSCVNCGQKLKQWKNNYSTILDAAVVTSLQTAVTKLKQDVLAYKRELVAKKQDFTSNPHPNSSSGSGGDQLTKHFRQEAKAKMLALHNHADKERGL